MIGKRDDSYSLSGNSKRLEKRVGLPLSKWTSIKKERNHEGEDDHLAARQAYHHDRNHGRELCGGRIHKNLMVFAWGRRRFRPPCVHPSSALIISGPFTRAMSARSS